MALNYEEFRRRILDVINFVDDSVNEADLKLLYGLVHQHGYGEGYSEGYVAGYADVLFGVPMVAGEPRGPEPVLTSAQWDTLRISEEYPVDS